MPNDEVMPPPAPSSCPFLTPVILPGKLNGSVDYRPIPCLGKRDPIKGGGCAAWTLCQELPAALPAALEIIRKNTSEAVAVLEEIEAK
jgi:hypothetical protein